MTDPAPADRIAAEIAAYRKSWGIHIHFRGERAILFRTLKRGYPIDYEDVDISGCEWWEAWAITEGAAWNMHKRKTDPTKLENPVKALSDPACERMYKDLWWRLTAVAWGDGSPRIPDTLTISVADGLWRGKLTDKDEGYVQWTAARSLDDLLSLVDERCASEEDWVRDKYWKPPVAPRKKRS